MTLQPATIEDQAQPGAPDRPWVRVCPVASLVAGRGVCALVDGHQVAVFLLDGEVFGLGNHDPFSGANVMSRGIVGSRGDRLKVVSPVYKQSFDMRTGECLDDPSVSIPVHRARIHEGAVWVESPGPGPR